jgi:hypothetical protein
MVNTTDNSLVTIKEKIKNFFKRMSNDKDSTVSGTRNNLDTNSKHLYRDDLKMY